MMEQIIAKPALSGALSDFWRRVMLPLAAPHALLFCALFFLLAVLTVIPLLTVLIASFRPSGIPNTAGWTIVHYFTVWGDPYTYSLVRNTMVFAVGSTVLAISTALGLTWLLERTDLPGRKLFRSALLMPMVTPPLLLATGWAMLLSPRIGIIPLGIDALAGAGAHNISIYSMAGMIFVQGLAYVPTAILIFSPVVRNMDPTFEEAAAVARATSLQILFRVSLPFLFPAILSTATILMIVGMLTFDVPAIIGIPGNITVMSTEIFRYMTPPIGLPEYGPSAALNSSLFIFLMPGLFIYLRLTRRAERFATISGKGYKASRMPLGNKKLAAVTSVSLYFALSVVLPLLALIWASLVPYFSGFDSSLLDKLSLSAYVTIIGSDRVWSAALNAAIVAAAAALGATLVALAASWALLRTRLRLAWLLDVMTMIPIGVPYLMMGVALIFLFLSFRTIPIYGTIWIIALGHLVIYLPIASRMMQAGLLQINRELEEAAMVARASGISNLIRIVAPLLKPTLVAILIWVFVHSLREFSLAVMLQSGRNEVLSTILFSFWENGRSDLAAAIAVLLMISLSALVAISHWLVRSHSEA